MRVKLTDIAIPTTYQPRAAHYAIGDTACPGLCLRVTPKGVKSFAFAFHNKATSKTEWLTIGRYPDVTLARAREIANTARATVARGGTPRLPKRVEAQKKFQRSPTWSRSTMTPS